MAGLTLTLKPREKFLVGGCLVENGPRRSSIRIIDENVFVLRLSDALHPDEVTTPVKRAYHAVQQILACEISEKDGHVHLLAQLKSLHEVFEGTAHEATIARACANAAAGKYHGALIGLKALIEVESKLLLTARPAPENTSENRLCAVSGRR
ncbi:MAG: flagellar biosynthesis repressor FlbT [Pseudomonadota bacterium]